MNVAARLERGVTALVLGAVCSAATAEVTFRVIERPAGATAFTATDLSGDGTVVVGNTTINGAARAFRWTSAAGFSLIEPGVGYTVSRAARVSADGSIVVGSVSNTGQKAQAAASLSGSPLSPLFVMTGDLGAEATGVSGDGTVIVGTFDGDRERVWRWTNGQRNDLLPPAGQEYVSGVVRLSADGSRVIGTSQPQAIKGNSAVAWGDDTAVMVLKSLVPPQDDYASAVSGNGAVVMGQGYDFESGHNYLWHWTEPSGHRPLPGPWSSTVSPALADVSNDGRIAVGRILEPDPVTQKSVSHAIIWRGIAGIVRVRDLLAANGVPLDGWTLQQAIAISDDAGTLLGSGTDAQGKSVVFLATLPVFCDADIDGNGFVNGDDIDLFAAYVETGDLRGDVNLDGFFTGDDIDLFAAASEQGC